MTSQGTAQPLSPEEMQALGRFLASAPGGPDGVWVDGYLHGIVSLPDPPASSEWLRDVTPPAATVTQAHAQRFYGFLTRHLKTVTEALRTGHPDPLADGSPEQSERWMEGFARGFMGQPEAIARLQHDDRAVQMVMLILSYSDLDARLSGSYPGEKDRRSDLQAYRDHSRRVFAESDPHRNREFLRVIAGLSHRLLHEAAPHGKTAPSTVRRRSPKIGPNEPCPCGSGLKYKKCHGKPGGARG